MTPAMTPTIPTASTISNKLNFKTAFAIQYTSELSYWLSLIHKQDKRLFVLVCRHADELAKIQAELDFFGVDSDVFVDYETLVYDRLSPHKDIISERIALLGNMPKTGVLLIALSTLVQKIAPPSFLLGQYFDIKVGDILEYDDQQNRLLKSGYRLVDTVYQAGEFAIRGGIVDIFVMGQLLPLRLELIDNEIESMRFFDTDSQKTLTNSQLNHLKRTKHKHIPNDVKINQFRVLPAREFAFEGNKDIFRQNFATHFSNISHRKVDLYQDVMNDIASAGIEYYTPLFFDGEDWQKNGTFFRYLPSDAVIIYPDNLLQLHHEFFEQLNTRYNNLRHNKDYPILSPDWLFLRDNEFFYELKKFSQVVIHVNTNHVNVNTNIDTDYSINTNSDTNTNKYLNLFDRTVLPNANVFINHQQNEPLQALVDFVNTCREPILLVAESASRRAIIVELLKNKIATVLVDSFDEFIAKPTSSVALTIAPIEEGLYIEHAFCVLSETQIFGRQIHLSRQKTSTTLSQAVLIKSVSELDVGALVVHIEHGIGRYLGLVVMDVGYGEQEFIHLGYADDASIYVPITHIALVGKYSGTDSQMVALSKIGSGKWDKLRQKTLTQIYDVAAELLNTQARRQAKQGIGFSIDTANYELFVSEFAFDETIDQRMAIEAVMADMKSNKPMDRLICGDVGFGKTEVAMRAAFIAVSAGYQVALLVPTTLLAHQHEDSFKNRFVNWPIRIESLSRFGNKKQHDQLLQELKDGKIDIIIGTHRLLQDDVAFAQLGLMIVDEEHRFGVRHKQKIKSLQSNVDSLSMTATPIPRTLNMALSGMQDISIIATPPARRLAVKTFVVEKNDQTIKDAILREILRGGQVFYLHNDVVSMPSVAESLTNLLPNAKIAMAHGQMHEKELSAVMSDFYHKRFNVLVASTIIETGIDMPNANTILINRADKFGLAQLHQLRGRVGRSHHQAYCYLLVPSMKGLTTDAQKRLDAISRANTLGAGFMLASEDLEIRGAGEILGKEQSGNIQTIGFGLYMDMLKRATQAIKEGKTPKLDSTLDLVGEINIHASALIDSDYVADVHERLILYKRLANCQSVEELNELKAEMIDRFGLMPTATYHLYMVHKIRLLAKLLQISKIDTTANHLMIEFHPDTPVQATAIIALLQSDNNYRMHGASAIGYQFKQEKSVDERLAGVFDLLHYFKNNSA